LRILWKLNELQSQSSYEPLKNFMNYEMVIKYIIDGQKKGRKSSEWSIHRNKIIQKMTDGEITKCDI
jgi:hypothetical protein